MYASHKALSEMMEVLIGADIFGSLLFAQVGALSNICDNSKRLFLIAVAGFVWIGEYALRDRGHHFLNTVFDRCRNPES